MELGTHTAYELTVPRNWTLYVSHGQPVRRLVVFVHGFKGRSVKTWLDFPAAGSRPWWREADLLFVGYKSLRDNITSVANRLPRELPKVLSQPATRSYGSQRCTS
jgi:hypothetical protein